MKVKVSELTRPMLDWAVAKCNNIRLVNGHIEYVVDHLNSEFTLYSPSIDWSQGGPIIERIDGFQLKIWLKSSPQTKCEAHIHNNEGDSVAFGETPLIAAMRCYVASKLGDTIDIPETI